MPSILTARDNKFLAKLSASKSPTFDSVQVRQLLEIIQRQTKAIEAADFRYSVVVVAATGLASEDEILAKGLPGDLCDQAVDLRRQYEDARRWRELSAAENEQAPSTRTQTMIDILDDPARAN